MGPSPSFGEGLDWHIRWVFNSLYGRTLAVNLRPLLVQRRARNQSGTKVSEAQRGANRRVSQSRPLTRSLQRRVFSPWLLLRKSFLELIQPPKTSRP